MRIHLFLVIASIGCLQALASGQTLTPEEDALALQPPVVNIDPGAGYSDAARTYGMVIGMDRTPGGRIWAVWVAGGDNEKGYFVAATNDDDGDTWSTPRLLINPTDAPSGMARRTLVGNIWTDPTDKLWLSFDQSMKFFDGRAGVWAITCDNPDDAKPIWSAPRRIWHGATLQKPTVLSNGDWLLPISLWERNKIPKSIKEAHHELDDQRMAHVFASTDHGKTWTRRGGVKFPNFEFDEHMTVERKSGQLWMLARNRDGIMETTSDDKGKTWSAPSLTTLGHVSARCFIRRLSSGSLLLVKHGAIGERTKERSHLTAFISKDDGKSWEGGLLLDERTGVSYPDGFQASDGRIFILYDHNRAADREILMARFGEQEIVKGQITAPTSRLRMLVNKALGDPAKRDEQRIP